MEETTIAKQNLYKVIKIKTSKIHNKVKKEKNSEGKYVVKFPTLYDVGTYTYEDAFENNELVSIGDNLVFHKIREYYEDRRTPADIYEEIRNLYKKRDEIKKKETSEENIQELKSINKNIDDMIYVKDIVNVKVTNKSHYEDIALAGFYMNGIKYKRLCCGSGQMRRNTVTFANEELYEYLTEALMCGLKDRINKINLAKFSAYFALSFSSVLWVRKPRICVVKDYNTILPNQKIDFIVNENGKKHVEERIMDIELNSADGEGLISPQCAEWFSQDMGLNYTCCNFVVRSVFVKGCLMSFDFVKYAKEVCGTNKIKSIYGEEFDIGEIDVILTESMFKMHSYFNGVKEYVDFHDKYNLKWGVARYNKKYDDKYSLLNYQYIQNNNLSDKDIDDLSQPTVYWFKKVCSGDKLYSLMYTIGCKKTDDTYDDVLNSCGSIFTKSILKNSNMLQDGYVRKKIYESIKESFRQAKIGRLWVNGNYQFMLSDPIPLIRNSLGLDATGLIPANHIYSNYWNTYNPPEIDLMRSPMVDRHEHNIVSLSSSTEMRYWYQYLYSGIIYSIYDTSTIRHSDADFDGDIVFSTDNFQLIKGAFRNNNPITYDKVKSPDMEMSYENIVKCDLNGFDTLVGQITNNSTSITAMLPNFPSDKYPEQYDELINRLKLLREIIGSEIDKIKLGVSPEFPKEWIERVKIDDSDSDIVKANKYKHNSLVINKKAYFMIYLYDNLFKSYRNHINQFNLDAKNKYGISYYDLKYSKNKTKGQRKFIKKAEYFSPILDTPCIMNKICHKFEKIEKEITFDKTISNSYLINFNKHKYEIDQNKLNEIELLYKQYQSQKKFIYIRKLMEKVLTKDKLFDYLSGMTEAINKDFSRKCFSIISNAEELFEHLIELSNCIHDFDYSFIWNILGEDILEVIPKEDSLVCVEDDNGIPYLGLKYKLFEVNK